MNIFQSDIDNNVGGDHTSINEIIERHQQAINASLDNKIRRLRINDNRRGGGRQKDLLNA